MSKKERPDPDPKVVKAFEDLYKLYETVRPDLLKMKIKANRLPTLEYLRPKLHTWKLRTLDKTHQILNRFIQSEEYNRWKKIRAENAEYVWDNHAFIDGSEEFAEVKALNAASKECELIWFVHEENNIFIKDKKKGKPDESTGEKDAS